jgi:cytoskeletal protein CcmA (bactofilin family)
MKIVNITQPLLLVAGILATVGIAGPVQAQPVGPGYPAAIMIPAAQGILQGTTIPSGTVVDSDVFLTGQTVSIDGTVNGNVVVLGDQVTINGTVNGSLILVGQNAVVSGQVSGGTYVAALTLEMASGAVLERDLYYAGVSLMTQSGAAVQRDLYAIGLDAGLSGHVGRSLHTVIGPIQLYNGLMRLLGFGDLIVRLHFTIPPPSTPTPLPTLAPQPTPTPVFTPTPENPIGGSVQSQAAVVGPVSHIASRPASAHYRANAVIDSNDVVTWVLQVLREWAVLFLFGILGLWLFNKPLERSAVQLRVKPLQSLAYGLLVLVIAINLFGVALLLAALVFVIGLGIGFLGLWGLALLFWTAAYACLSFSLVVLWAFIVYGTKVIVAYLTADWLLGSVLPVVARYKAVPLFLGTLVYALLATIPLFSWVLAVLVTATGMGAAWLAYRAKEGLAAPSIPASKQPDLPDEQPPSASTPPAPVKKKRGSTSSKL